MFKRIFYDVFGLPLLSEDLRAVQVIAVKFFPRNLLNTIYFA